MIGDIRRLDEPMPEAIFFGKWFEVWQMADMTTRLGPSGRIVIPVEYRKAMGIEVGDEVILSLEGDEVRVRGRAHAVKHAQALVRRYVGTDRSLSEELIAERREETDQE